MTDLQKFKKADKARKLVLANRAGYATTDAYLKWLQEQSSKSTLNEVENRITPLFEKLFTKMENSLKEKTAHPIKKVFKVEDIVTITQHYKIKEINGSIGLNVKLEKIEGAEKGQEVSTDLNSLKSIFKSGDNFEFLEEKTRTELIEIIENNKHSCMTVGFFKKDTEKSKAQYELEKQQRKEKVKSANLASVDAVLEDLIENPLSKTIPGEYRIMRGYHYNTRDAHGRLQFIDADSKEVNKMKLVDLRSINLVICDNTKYVLKK